MRGFSPEKVPVPPDFKPLTAPPGVPLDVEIGCGVGFHPIHYARANPGRFLVAIERTSEKFAKFEGRLRGHAPLPNLLPVHGDAVAWVTHGLAPESVHRYFLLYPNPYPKESQRNLRFHAMPFFARLLATMKTGGTLTLATNSAAYAEEAVAETTGEWGMRLREGGRLPADFSPRTHFEKKYLLRGETCWNFVFEK